MAFLFSGIFLACVVVVSTQDTPPSFTDVLSAHQNLSSYQALLQDQFPDLLDQIANSSSPVTILAPDNAAFDKIEYYPVIGPAWAAQDTGMIRSIMDYHILRGSHTSDTMNSTFQYYETWLTNTTVTNVTDGQRVGGVMQAGYMPQMVWTSAFSSRSIVKAEDIAFDGGIIHVIDSLVIPPTSFPDTASRFSLASEPYGLDSFLGAVYSTSNMTLASLLNITSDVTILAPNNIGMNTVTPTITSLSNSTLDDLLSYHIILSPSGPLFSTNFANGTTVTTLRGSSITFTLNSNSWYANSAKILTQDLLLANGVMHVLDNVLSPNSTSIQPNPTLATQVPVLQSTLPAEFNSSMAPFTTNLPNAVQTGSAADGASYIATSTGGLGSSPSTTGVSSSTLENGARGGGNWVATVVLCAVAVILYSV